MDIIILFEIDFGSEINMVKLARLGIHEWIYLLSFVTYTNFWTRTLFFWYWLVTTLNYMSDIPVGANFEASIASIS